MNIKLKNFTLVELVIIISIVLIITAAFIPVMMLIREKAKTNNCLNNQKQCGYYLSMAQNDLGKIINGEPQAAWARILSANIFNENSTGLGYFKVRESDFLRCIKNKSIQKRGMNNVEKLRNTFGMQGPDNISHPFWTAAIDSAYVKPESKEIKFGYKNTINGALHLDKYTIPKETMLLIDSKFISAENEIMFDNNKSEYLIRYQNKEEYMHSDQKGVPYLAHQNSANILFSDIHASTINRTKVKSIYYKKNNICINQYGEMANIKRGLKLYEIFTDDNNNKNSIILLNE